MVFQIYFIQDLIKSKSKRCYMLLLIYSWDLSLSKSISYFWCIDCFANSRVKIERELFFKEVLPKKRQQSDFSPFHKSAENHRYFLPKYSRERIHWDYLDSKKPLYQRKSLSSNQSWIYEPPTGHVQKYLGSKSLPPPSLPPSPLPPFPFLPPSFLPTSPLFLPSFHDYLLFHLLLYNPGLTSVS